MMIRTYTELSQLPTLEDRFDYLMIGGTVAHETFGSDRWLNQSFYHSVEWRAARSIVIARDLGMDLGVFDNPIRGLPSVHHMNPITLQDIDEGSDNLFDPEGLISASHRTHNAIHYGNRSHLPRGFTERRPGDTKLSSSIRPL